MTTKKVVAGSTAGAGAGQTLNYIAGGSQSDQAKLLTAVDLLGQLGMLAIGAAVVQVDIPSDENPAAGQQMDPDIGVYKPLPVTP